MKRALLLLAMIVALLASACTVPTNDAATPVAPEDLPPDLQPVVTEAPTTTTPPTGEEVMIYLYNTETQLLQPVMRRVQKASVTVDDALRELLQAVPTQEERSANLITQLVADPDDDDPEGNAELELIQVQSGPRQVRVRIRGDVSGGPQAQAQAFAQIVFTASQPDLDGTRPLVLIQRPNGNNVQVVIEGDTVDDRPVTRGDYPSLDPDNEQSPESTTTTSTTQRRTPTTTVDTTTSS